MILFGPTLGCPIVSICLFWELNYCCSEFKKMGQIGELHIRFFYFSNVIFYCYQSDTYTKGYRGFYKANGEEL